MSIFGRIRSYTKTRRGGATCFSAAIIGTGLLLCTSTGSWMTMPVGAIQPSVSTSTSPDGVSISGSLSQTKLTEGGSGEVYLKLTVAAPEIDVPGEVGASDIVVVLDRSGSMSAAQKMPYAKQAIYSLVSKLNPEDRFALVSFDSHARVDFALAPMTHQNQMMVRRIVSAIRSGSSTNMSEGLERAETILRRFSQNSRRRVILLSDGEANQGKTSPQALSQIARNITGAGGVVSTIGMGLSFNELVMASLADNGMGHYSFLEDVRGLHAILAKDLNESRSLFAESSTIEIELPSDVRLVDAAGYPTHLRGANRIAIDSGQLVGGVERQITLSLQVPTRRVAEFEIAPIKFSYSREGALTTLPGSGGFALAVLPAERHEEAIASIDDEVLKSTWVGNNLGRMRKDLNTYIREGKKEKARQTIADYSKSLQEAESASGVRIANEELRAELDQIQSDIDDAFVGTPSAQQSKQSRLGKTLHLKARAEQRVVVTK